MLKKKGQDFLRYGIAIACTCKNTFPRQHRIVSKQQQKFQQPCISQTKVEYFVHCAKDQLNTAVKIELLLFIV